MIILILRILSFISRIDKAVINLDEILDVVKVYVIDLKTTIHAINNVSMSVEAIRVTLDRFIKKYYRKAVTEVEEVKAWIKEFMEKNSKPEETTEVVVRKEEKNDD
ncbi:MAG: hypothetical protein IJM15_00010 [Erysipelotrichaceae bacterium]|nr:hypothetical protein [Erysipelotrichaceae bacterium]